MASFIDLHSHVLPALDDGAKAQEEGLSMLRALSDIGFSEVFATPHQRSGLFLPSGDAISNAHAALESGRAAANIPLRLRLGAENMWDEVFLGRIEQGKVPSYDNGPAFLVEVPVQALPMHMEDHLFHWRARGLLPVVAHPERYAPLWTDFDRVTKLGQTAALLVDLGALEGAHGAKQAKLGRKLVEMGIAHAVASDVHTVEDVRVANRGIAWIRKHCGEAAVVRLLVTNPTKILAGELPETDFN